MWEEFKKFALKGNVMDMAVGVIIGGAFGKIVSSLVADLIMPVLAFIMGGASMASMKWVLSPAVMDGETVVKAENAIMYGQFIQNVIDFFIIALCIFFMVKAINKLGEKKRLEAEAAKAAEEAAKPKEPTELELLGEIRDLLKKDA